MRVAILLSLLACAAAVARAADDPPFAAVMAAADQAASHGDGMRYANLTKHYLLSRHETDARDCAEASSVPSLRFDMLVRLLKDGTVDLARVEPETPTSLCVAKAVVGTRVGPPDKAPWVVHVEWEIETE